MPPASDHEFDCARDDANFGVGVFDDTYSLPTRRSIFKTSRANPPAAPLAQPSHTGEHTASGGSTPPPVLSPESQHFETGQEH